MMATDVAGRQALHAVFGDTITSPREADIMATDGTKNATFYLKKGVTLGEDRLISLPLMQ